MLNYIRRKLRKHPKEKRLEVIETIRAELDKYEAELLDISKKPKRVRAKKLKTVSVDQKMEDVNNSVVVGAVIENEKTEDEKEK